VTFSLRPSKLKPQSFIGNDIRFDRIKQWALQPSQKKNLPSQRRWLKKKII
jgi:hypothetical protein